MTMSDHKWSTKSIRFDCPMQGVCFARRDKQCGILISPPEGECHFQKPEMGMTKGRRYDPPIETKNLTTKRRLADVNQVERILGRP